MRVRTSKDFVSGAIILRNIVVAEPNVLTLKRKHYITLSTNLNVINKRFKVNDFAYKHVGDIYTAPL